MKTESKVNPTLVKRMVGYYGTLEVARKAYAEARQDVREHNAGPSRMLGGKVLWVAGNGEIVAQYAAAVFYDRSPDAASVLPMK